MIKNTDLALSAILLLGRMNLKNGTGRSRKQSVKNCLEGKSKRIVHFYSDTLDY